MKYAMRTSADECRAHAQNCQAKASKEEDLGMRTALFGMANNWAALAHHKDRLLKMMQEREGSTDC
jgi:hypothetical protein